MKFLVEILNGSSFEIEVDGKDTLLEVKQKIEKSQRIPVSRQTLVVDGCVILREDLNVDQCKIVQDSHLQLDLSYDNSNLYGDDQMPQTEPAPEPWVSVEEHFERQGWPLTAEEIRKIYSYQPGQTTQEIINIQDSPVTAEGSNKNQMLDQIEQSPPSNSTDHIIKSPQDSTGTVQQPQTEQSPASNLVMDPPVNDPTKIQVYLSSLCSIERKAWKGWSNRILVNVNTTDQVKILRNELVERERRGLINLPQDGFSFMKGDHNVLNEDQSFEQNGVLSPVNCVLMVPGHLMHLFNTRRSS